MGVPNNTYAEYKREFAIYTLYATATYVAKQYTMPIVGLVTVKRFWMDFTRCRGVHRVIAKFSVANPLYVKFLKEKYGFWRSAFTVKKVQFIQNFLSIIQDSFFHV